MRTPSRRAQAVRGFLETHNKAMKAVILLLMTAGMVAASEVYLRSFVGLGNPVLYDSSPLYGFRPQPNQTLKRFRGSTISLNNLGLRTDEDWYGEPDNKVLFLGDSVTYGGSYIGNTELFSTLAVSRLPGFKAGNAGVNSWGVENIHGLIVLSEFLPAKTYVTVLVEADFYRGVTRLQGAPYWSVIPSSGWHELLFFALYRLNNTRYVNWRKYASDAHVARVVSVAASKLVEMDRLLTSRGMRHLVYISPTRRQADGTSNRDERVLKALREHGLAPIYIVDRLRSEGIAAAGLYYDSVHLDRRGHEVWGRLIGADLARELRAETARAERQRRHMPGDIEPAKPLTQNVR